MRTFIFLTTLVCFSRSDDSCGDVTSPTGRISSPNYPYAASPNTKCIWTFIPAVQAKWLFFHFDNFHLTQDDYLIIEEKNATHKFQGIRGPFTVIVDASSKVTFQTTPKSNDSEFRASYSNLGCSFTIGADHGLLESPIYARRQLPDSFNCSWAISAASEGHRSFLISFAEFQLNNSVISVYKDLTDLIATYSGNDIPDDVIVGSTLAKVQLVVQVSSPVVKLKIEFATVSLRCAKTMQVNDAIVLSEVVWLPEPVECVWILKSDPKTTLMVKKAEVNLLNLQDVIIINDGNSRYAPNLEIIDHATKDDSDSFTTSSANMLYISFLSVPISGLSNFTFNISAQTQGGTFYDHGEFSFEQSPSFKGQDIVFTLLVNSSLMIEVSVETKNLQDTSEILFYEIKDNAKKLIATFNKNTELFPVFSKSNKMVVVLRGFLGTEELTGKFHGIVQGCDTFDQTNVGSYELQRNVSGNCTWLIKPSNLAIGDMISLTFSKLNLNNKDILAVYKSMSNKHEDLVQVFNSQIHGQPQLYVEARSGIRLDMQIESSESTSQVISFYQLQGGCNSNISISPGPGIDISSVGYPSHYLLNKNCEWRVLAPSNSTLFVNFVDVDIYTDNNLQLYSLKNGSEELIESTNGQIYPDDIIINSQQLIVKWNSTSRYEMRPARGFSLHIRLLDCGANLTTPSGDLMTPGYPYPVNESVDCIWGIAVPKPQSDSVNIIHFDVNWTPSAENPSLFEIFDGGSLTSRVVSLEESNATTSLSRTNKLIVRYTNKGGIGSGYKLSFSSKECTQSHQCRNKICMHDEWRCNGINDCGDFSDEENCDSFQRKPGVSIPWFSASVVLALLFGIALTVLVPIGIGRFRRWRQERQPSSFSILPDDTEEFE